MKTFPMIGWMALLMIACSLQLGCGSGGETAKKHEHDEHEHEHPESYAEAVAEIKEMDEHIREALASDTPKDADHNLHEVFHFIKDLPKLAEKAGLKTEDVEAIETAKEQLLDAYSELDAQFHGKAEVAYDEVAEEIKSALETLEKLVPPESGE